MRITFAILALVAAVFGAASTSFGGDDRNAATWYRKAIAEYERLSTADRDLIDDYSWDPAGPPSPEVRAALARAGEMLRYMRRGAAQPFSDLDLDYRLGLELPLPHLARMRQLTSVGKTDAYVRMQDGDTSGAADALGALYGMSGHLSSDRTLISSLVGSVMFKNVDQAVREGFDRAAFDAADSSRLLRATQTLDPRDPFGMLESVFTEQEVIVAWLDTRFGNAEDRPELLEAVMWIPEDQKAQFANLAAMDDEAFAGAIDEYDGFMSRVVELMADPDHEAARAGLVQLEKEIAAGEHGQIAALMAPSYTKVFDRMLQTNEMVHARVEMLEGVVKGEIQLADEANAAHYYRAAIERLGELDEEKIEALRGLADLDIVDVEATLDDDLAETLAHAADAIGLLREGSTKKRCDFRFNRVSPGPALAPDYAAGMRDAYRVLHADAVRLLRAGKTGDAAERIGICYRVVAHLSVQETIAVTLVAHRGFERTTTLAERLLEELEPAGAERHALHADAGRISKRDPFGYVQAVVTTRGGLEGRVERIMESALDAPEKAAARALAVMDGDALLLLLVVLETMEAAARDHAPPGAATLRPLRDVISFEALARARVETARIAPFLAQGRLDVLVNPAGSFKASEIAGVADRSRRARQDLRRGLAMLEPAREPEREPEDSIEYPPPHEAPPL